MARRTASRTVEPCILPRPKRVTRAAGHYRLPAQLSAVVSEQARGELPATRRLLRRHGIGLTRVKVGAGPGCRIALGKRPDALARPGAKPRGDEGYVLAIRPRGIVLAANTAVGVFWALQTLSQLIEDGRRLPCLEIRDWPDLAMRGVHLDLKGSFPRRQYLWDVIDRLASFKINTVLVEYEDKIAYAGRKHGFVSPHALSDGEVRRFVHHCRNRHITVIPLLQCLGHAEYVLRHPRYAALREVKDRYDQFCPSNPETLRLFRECAGQLADLHPDSEWFHIGGDETRALGLCPRCKRKAARVGRIGLYFEHTLKVVAAIRSLGKRAIVWDDMLTRTGHPDLIARLPAGTALMYWDYFARGPREPWFTMAGRVISEQWLARGAAPDGAAVLPANFSRFLERGLPAESQAAFDAIRSTLWRRDSPLYFNSLPYMPALKDAGVEVIGAPAIRISRENRIPDYRDRVGNIRHWAKAAKSNGLRGVISTSWARSCSIRGPGVVMEDVWYPTLVSAACFWHTAGSSKDLDARFHRRFLGLSGSSATDLVYTLYASRNEKSAVFATTVARALDALAERAPRNARSLRYLAFLARVEALARFVKNDWLDYHGGFVTPRVPLAGLAPEIRKLRQMLRNQLARARSLRREGLQLYRETLFADEARERVETLILPLETMLKAALAQCAHSAARARKPGGRRAARRTRNR